jgi:transcriptional regulator with XRE-family HTH domain
VRAAQRRLEEGGPDPKALRRQAGRWLKGLREAAGLTQADVADKLGLRYYTFVSQVEGGHGRVPSDQIAHWADALGVARRELATELLRFYEPELFGLLFTEGQDVASEV